MLGKQIRLDRLRDRKTKRMLLIPMDHGFGMGPIEGLEDMASMVNKVAEGGANAVLLHKGVVKSGYRGYGKDIGLIIHMSGSTALAIDGNAKVLTCSVEEALKLGADGVSIHVNIGAQTEAKMLEDAGRISRECEEWGIPLLTMVYARGEGIKKDMALAEKVAMVSRTAYELGTDIIKTSYTGDVKSFEKVVNSCPVPIVIAGGPKMDTEKDVLEMVKDSIECGGAGVAFGRNVFQARDPTALCRALSLVIHKNGSIKEALELLKE
ncbi:MAG: 2-amino-3,7-dideoxy-D-threo-hept-6-ulosonate synthase [Candidatus Micrarchaeota archaeon]